MDGDKRWTNLANGGRSVEGSTIECPFLLPYEHKGTRYYYLFRTWGENGPRRWNKYEIMVGRATSPKDPYLHKKAFVWIKNASPVPGVYLVGGSSHPGGGLPLVMLSAKIVAEIIGP